MTPAERVLDELDSSQRGLSPKRLRLWLVSAAILVFYVVSWNLAGIDLQKLGTGLPKLAHWIAQAWPPRAHRYRHASPIGRAHEIEICAQLLGKMSENRGIGLLGIVRTR